MYRVASFSSTFKPSVRTFLHQSQLFIWFPSCGPRRLKKFVAVHCISVELKMNTELKNRRPRSPDSSVFCRLLACRTGVIIFRFSGERRHRARLALASARLKSEKITPVLQASRLQKLWVYFCNQFFWFPWFSDLSWIAICYWDSGEKMYFLVKYTGILRKRKSFYCAGFVRVMKLWNFIFQAWKVVEFDCGSCKVMKNGVYGEKNH